MIDIKKYIDYFQIPTKVIKERLAGRLLPESHSLKEVKYTESVNFDVPFVYNIVTDSYNKVFIYGISSYSKDSTDTFMPLEEARANPKTKLLITRIDY